MTLVTTLICLLLYTLPTRSDTITRLNGPRVVVPRNISTAHTRISSYKRLLLHSEAFIDKSLLIKEILSYPQKLIMINCPQSWGKSINLDMMKNFFEIEVDRYGRELIPRSNSYNNMLFAKGAVRIRMEQADLRYPLLISYESDIMKMYQGRHPVILINFHGINADSYIKIMDLIRERVSIAFQRHHYMVDALFDDIDRTLLEQRDKELFRKYMSHETLSTKDIAISIRFLSRVLYEHFGRTVFVLMDEYDVLLDLSLHRNFIVPGDNHRIIKLLTLMLGSTIQNNEAIEKVILTGVLPISQRHLPIDTNETLHSQAFMNHFYRFYGYTEDEVNMLFQHHDIPPELAQQAHGYYKGYKMFKNATVLIYNPWSINQFVKKRKISNYWQTDALTYCLKPLFRLRSIRVLFESLYLGNYERFRFTSKIHSNNLNNIRQLIYSDSEPPVDGHKLSLLLTYLRDLGYLTNVDYTYNSQGLAINTKIRIPNREVAEDVVAVLRNYYHRTDNISFKMIEEVGRRLNAFIEASANITSQSFARHFEACIKDIEIYTLASHSSTKVSPNGLILQSIRSYLAIKMHSVYKFAAKTFTKAATNADIVLYKGDLGVVIKLLYGSRVPAHALNDAKKQLYIFNSQPFIKRVRLIGISVSANKSVSVMAENVQLPDHRTYPTAGYPTYQIKTSTPIPPYTTHISTEYIPASFTDEYNIEYPSFK
ncbi:uncharacterized protein LOC135838057 [Planococcus citri]|uniref:uncharacterized protein LOC135838057 n=1 Tax=Planococcus citri TaxID=170843 RepID=UPI0031F9F523